MSDQTTVLACVPIDWGSTAAEVVEGSKEEFCADCGTSIWVSPASKRSVGENPIFCCLPCMAIRFENDDDLKFVPVSDEQIEELRVALADLGKRPK